MIDWAVVAGFVVALVSFFLGWLTGLFHMAMWAQRNRPWEDE